MRGMTPQPGSAAWGDLWGKSGLACMVSDWHRAAAERRH